MPVYITDGSRRTTARPSVGLRYPGRLPRQQVKLRSKTKVNQFDWSELAYNVVLAIVILFVAWMMVVVLLA